MQFLPISDWDDAYANAAHIAGGMQYPKRWQKAATTFTNELLKNNRANIDQPYGVMPRNKLDIFFPDTKPEGIVVFIHGGYWMSFDKSYFSHLARGSLQNGYMVAMPSYRLCPEVSIAEITCEIALAIKHIASSFEGEIKIAGHSAGGHLALRMICENSPLDREIQKRITNVLSISALSDLRPLTGLKINEHLNITPHEADNESPAILRPMQNARLTCWVGADERPEFIRQSRLLAIAWHGLGAKLSCIEEPDRHHFNVIDGLCVANSKMINTLLE